MVEKLKNHLDAFKLSLFWHDKQKKKKKVNIFDRVSHRANIYDVESVTG